MGMTALPGAAALLMLRNAFLCRELVDTAHRHGGVGRDRPPNNLGSMSTCGSAQSQHHEAQQEENPAHRTARLTELGQQGKTLVAMAANSVRHSGAAVLVAAVPVIREHFHDAAGFHLPAAALSEHAAQFVPQ